MDLSSLGCMQDIIHRCYCLNISCPATQQVPVKHIIAQGSHPLCKMFTCMQALDSELPRSSKAGFDQAVWRERTINLEAKEAAAAAAAAVAVGNGAADSGHDSDHESAKAGSSSSQVGATTTNRISPNWIQLMCKSAISDGRPISLPNV